MDARSAFELMGKPTADVVEAKISQASAEYRAISDPIEANAKLELVSTYLSVARHIEEQTALTQGKASLGKVATQIAEVKKTLGEHDRIEMQEGQVKYQVLTPNGNVLDASDANSVGVERSIALTTDLRRKIATGEKGALRSFVKACKASVEREDRVVRMQDAINQIARCVTSGMELIFTKGDAQINILGERSLARDYNARLALIKGKKDTKVDVDGLCFVDGKQVPTFWGVK